MSLDPEIEQIIKEKKQKYFYTFSQHLTNFGIILLVSLAVGLIYFQFEPISDSPEITPEQIKMLRLKFGLLLSAEIIAPACAIIYLAWILWRARKFKKEATDAIWNAALERTKKK